MAISKVIYNSKVLLDLTNDTVTADKMLKGTTAHDKSGALIIGTHECTAFETWVFELEDGTTVEKAVNVSD